MDSYPSFHGALPFGGRFGLPALLASLSLFATQARAELRAGAAQVDITPVQLPVLVNGGMLSRTADAVKTPLSARSICLSDGTTQLAIVVVDSCMVPRALQDEAKALASKHTGIPANRILICATHTHTAPSSMSCLGTEADPRYVPFLRQKLAEAVAEAQANLEPAEMGIAVTQAPEMTALRRWIRRPDRLDKDPFGNPTVRANMHSAANWDNVTGESGPEDPDLSLVSIRALTGRPLAVFANFSMHYFSDKPLSADYFGLFSEDLQDRLEPQTSTKDAPFVAMMSHGCSGDIWRRDYRKPPGERGENTTIEEYARKMTDLAETTLRQVKYRADLSLAMEETRLPMRYRVPDVQLLEWSRRMIEGLPDGQPKTREQVYAREQIILDEWQSTEVVVQAIRIGDFAIATTPNETYALTGLKIKAQSPLQPTIVLDLANGGDGYIPPPEQHRLGGYNTWPARSAGLEVTAEPRIAEAAVKLLEKVSGKPRRSTVQPVGPASQAILNAQPLAYWRLDEFEAPRAADASGHQQDAIYEPGVVYFLEGPHSTAFSGPTTINRAAHFVGDRLRAHLENLGKKYTVSFWFWNGMPNEGREVTGWLCSRDRDHSIGWFGDHLGIAGTAHPGKEGRLMFLHGADESRAVLGATPIQRWTWHHAALVRDGDRIRVHLDGKLDLETTAPADFPASFGQLFLGGRSDHTHGFEGRMDEIAVFDRALSSKEILKLLESH